MSKKQKLGNSEATHIVEVFNSEDLLTPDEALYVTKCQGDHQTAKSRLILFPPWTSTSMVKKNYNVQVVDGFTQNAVRNLICLDSEKIFVFEVTETRIKFLSSKKLIESISSFIKTANNTSRLNISCDSGVIFISSKNAERSFAISIDKKTGEVSSQRETSLRAISSRGVSRVFSHLRISGSKKRRASVYSFDQTCFTARKNKIFVISRKKAAFVLDLPNLGVRNIESAQKVTPLEVYDMCQGRGKQVITTIIHNSVCLLFLELATKKILSKKFISLGDLLFRRFEEVLPQNHRMLYHWKLQDVYFLDQKRLLVGALIRIGYNGRYLGLFSIDEPLKSIDPSKVRIRVVEFLIMNDVPRLMLREERGRSHLFYCYSDEKEIAHLVDLDPISLKTEHLMNEDDHDQYLFDPDLTEKTYSKTDLGSSVIARGTSTLLVGHNCRRSLDRVTHMLKLNLKENKFCYLDDIMVWSKEGVIQIVKLTQDRKTKDKRIDQVNEIFPRNHHMMLYRGKEYYLNLYRLENGNYMIYYVVLTIVPPGLSKKGLMSYEIDPESLSIVNTELNPFDDDDLAMSQAFFPIYRSSGFLVFCCNEKLSK